MRRYLRLLIMILVVLLIGCSSGNFKPDTLSKNDLSIVKLDDKKSMVSYGMKRADAEKILGTGKKDELGRYEYDFGVSIGYRVDKDSGDETVAFIMLEEESSNVYSTIRGSKIGDLKSEVMKLYGEKYPMPTYRVDRDISYVYDLKNKRFLGQVTISERVKADELMEHIGADFIFNDDGYVNKIMLYDRHMAMYLY